MLITALSILASVVLDWFLGEPSRYHPLVGFGWLVNQMERLFYGGPDVKPMARIVRGTFALFLLLFIFTTAAAALAALPAIGNVLSVFLLYLAIGHKSLHDHAIPIVSALQNNNDNEARQLVSRMVSRDSSALDITGAATESVLENGNDGVFGALFWFLIAGGAGAVLYRLVNTLDAMWGYRNDRYQYFGKAAAHLDDLLNYIPARLTALTYALIGHTWVALSCWKTQAPSWDSPNAGPVMAAGAGAMGVSIGGPACYLGEWHNRPSLGLGLAPDLNDIVRALKLVRKGVWLWTGLLLFVAIADLFVGSFLNV